MSGGGWRTWWVVRVRCMHVPKYAPPTPQAPTTQKASFHVEGGGPLAVEDGELAFSLEYPSYVCATLHRPVNQQDPPAITHH